VQVARGVQVDRGAQVDRAAALNARGGARSDSGDDLSRELAAARAGDEQAFRVVYRTVAPGLLRYLRVLVGDDAEDVASETWLQIARDLATFGGDGEKFRGWAATVARHRALDHLRARRRRPVADVPVDALESLAGGHDTAALALEAVSTEAAIALIATLPRDQAEAVLLRAVLGLDAEAAGRVLGKRAGAVRTAAHRGLRRLAEQLDTASRAQERASRAQERASRAREPGGPGQEPGGRAREPGGPGQGSPEPRGGERVAEV
jgi:RNA polymerase sigma-70 factor (ECF subfamily)